MVRVELATVASAATCMAASSKAAPTAEPSTVARATVEASG